MPVCTVQYDVCVFVSVCPSVSVTHTHTAGVYVYLCSISEENVCVSVVPTFNKTCFIGLIFKTEHTHTPTHTLRGKNRSLG